MGDKDIIMEVLAGNRDLREQIKEAEQMLTRIEIEKLPSYELGMERGVSSGVRTGILVGERGILRRQLTRRFGILPAEIMTRLEEADTEELELWSDSILTAQSLDEVFR